MAAAEAVGISERSARKWLARWRSEGEPGLRDRSSAPKRVPSRLPADRLRAIEALRRLRMTAAEIAEVLSMALSTVSRWLARIGLGKRSRLTPLEPPNRYERERPGELIHIDIKKLGRISRRGAGHRVTGNRKSQVTGDRGRGVTGWEFVHVCVDDATRLAYVEVLSDEKGAAKTAAALRRHLGDDPFEFSDRFEHGLEVVARPRFPVFLRVMVEGVAAEVLRKRGARRDAPLFQAARWGSRVGSVAGCGERAGAQHRDECEGPRPKHYSWASSRRRVATAVVAPRMTSRSAASFSWPLT